MIRRDVTQPSEAEKAARAQHKQAHEEEVRLKKGANDLRAQEAADKREEKCRRQALISWRANGGTADDFDKQWEQMYKDIIYQKTVADMSSSDPLGTQAAIRATLKF